MSFKVKFNISGLRLIKQKKYFPFFYISEVQHFSMYNHKPLDRFFMYKRQLRDRMLNSKLRDHKYS
jgi:hypothetical protein